MGEAKRRRAEIERLKQASPEDAARWRQAKLDEKTLAYGIDPTSRSPEGTAAMARRLLDKLNSAKSEGSVDSIVTFLMSRVDATVRDLRDVPVACHEACPHCCYVWVSVSAVEALYVAKLVKAKGQAAIDRVIMAHDNTKNFEFDVRDQHPYPCPLLDNNCCSIYEFRPRVCRLACSGDANVCARSYRNITAEDIPTPVVYLASRGCYAIALDAALRKSHYSYRSYEFNAALVRAISVPDAERLWLSGRDVFEDVPCEAGDLFVDEPNAQRLYDTAFG